MPQAGPFGGPLDQAGNIGHDKALFGPHTHHAQIGMQGGEGVVCNLGPCVAHGRNEGGLAGIGHAEQPHIGQHLEFELEASALARMPQRLLPGGSVDGALEAQVAKAAITALGHEHRLVGHEQLVQHFARLGVAHDGADRHLEGDVLAGRAEHVGPHAMLAASCLEAACIAVVDQRVEVGICHGPDVAAASAVPAVGAAEFLVFFMAERSAAIAAVARSDVDERFVYKFHGDCTRKSGDAPCAPGCRRLHH